MSIVISSGHGEYVAGANMHIKERDEAVLVVERVCEYYIQNDVPFEKLHERTARTQNDNVNNIISYHNSKTRKLDISVHFNSNASTTSPMGVEVLSKNNSDLAGIMSETISAASGLKNRGYKHRTDLGFLNRTSNSAILIETCFVDSTADVAIYKNKFDEICEAIAYVSAKRIGHDVSSWKPGKPSWEGKTSELAVSNTGTSATTSGSSVSPEDGESTNSNTLAGLRNKETPNADGGFKVTRGSCGLSPMIIIDKQPLEETLGTPIYPDLITPSIGEDDYEFNFEDIEEEMKEAENANGVSHYISFESFIKKGVDIAKIFFDYKDYKERTNVYDAKKNRYYSKIPNFDKPKNNNDPFPVDEKIEELEQHIPFMKIHRLAFCDPHLHTVQLAKVIMDLSDKVEKRVVQLENNMAVLYRNLFRMAARVEINCVYYGGQNEFSKYNAIRCLHHDRVNDGQMMSLDQCLNCDRYEPILGKTYEIEDDTGRSLSIVNDDNQMAYQPMQDELNMAVIEEKPSPKEPKTIDLSKIQEKEEGLRDFKEMWDEGFIMDWDFVPIEKQIPHVLYDDGSDSKRLDSNYKNIETHNDMTGAGGEGMGVFYGPPTSAGMSEYGYGGGYLGPSSVGSSGGAGSIGAGIDGPGTSIEATERVKKLIEENQKAFDASGDPELKKLLQSAKNKVSKRISGALANMHKYGFEEELKQAAIKHGLDPLFILSIAFIESNGNPSSYNGRFAGIMQASCPSSTCGVRFKAMSDKEKVTWSLTNGVPHMNDMAGYARAEGNPVLMSISYNSGQSVIVGSKANGAVDISNSEFLRGKSRASWTFVDIWPAFKNNVKRVYGAPASYSEKTEYYPLVHYMYQALLESNTSMHEGLTGNSLGPSSANNDVPISLSFPYDKKEVDNGKKIVFQKPYILSNKENHYGNDYSGGAGSKITAAAEGTVERIILNDVSGGNYITIKHDKDVRTIYYHLQSNSIKVKKGDKVKDDTVIGLEGSTGKTSTGKSQLHFEIQVGSTSISRDKRTRDPAKSFVYLKGSQGKEIKFPK